MWEKLKKCGRIEGMEGYPSGRRGLIANELVWGNLERGFKSLTLRQGLKLSLKRKFSKGIGEPELTSLLYLLKNNSYISSSLPAPSSSRHF